MRLNLQCHPDSATDTVQSITVDVSLSPKELLTLTFHVTGNMSQISLLDKAISARTDYLWQHSCFEAFIMSADGPEYLEFNLSPSTEWAAYAFDSHRRGMQDIELQSDPAITAQAASSNYQLLAELDLIGQGLFDKDAITHLGISAIIEETNGHKSLWALAHPADKPDFHHRDCFVYQLKAP